MCGPRGKIHTGPVQRFFHLPEDIQCLLGASGCPVAGRQTAQNGILGIFILIKNAGGAAIELNRPGIPPLHRADLHASIEGCARFRTQNGSQPRPGNRGEIQISAAVHFRANPLETAFLSFLEQCGMLGQLLRFVSGKRNELQRCAFAAQRERLDGNTFVFSRLQVMSIFFFKVLSEIESAGRALRRRDGGTFHGRIRFRRNATG